MAYHKHCFEEHCEARARRARRDWLAVAEDEHGAEALSFPHWLEDSFGGFDVLFTAAGTAHAVDFSVEEWWQGS